jgi:hypothetical protein
MSFAQVRRAPSAIFEHIAWWFARRGGLTLSAQSGSNATHTLLLGLGLARFSQRNQLLEVPLSPYFPFAAFFLTAPSAAAWAMNFTTFVINADGRGLS